MVFGGEMVFMKTALNMMFMVMLAAVGETVIYQWGPLFVKAGTAWVRQKRQLIALMKAALGPNACE